MEIAIMASTDHDEIHVQKLPLGVFDKKTLRTWVRSCTPSVEIEDSAIDKLWDAGVHSYMVLSFLTTVKMNKYSPELPEITKMAIMRSIFADTNPPVLPPSDVIITSATHNHDEGRCKISGHHYAECVLPSHNDETFDEHGRTFAHHAAIFGEMKTVLTWFRRFPESLEWEDEYQMTPFDYAAMQGHMQLCEYFCTLPLARSLLEEEEGPIYVAELKDQMEIAEYLKSSMDRLQANDYNKRSREESIATDTQSDIAINPKRSR